VTLISLVIVRRFAWFDCLRCAAILLVILTHSRNIALPTVAAPAWQFLHRMGWNGVDLFFVLSGFLVSGLLFGEHEATGTLNIRRFWVRRAFKIIPPFYVLVLVTVVHDAFVFHRVNVVHLVHDVFFLQSYRAGAWPHAWTLAIEVHFYLLLALLLGALARKSAPTGEWLAQLPGLLMGLMILTLIARLITSGVHSGHFNFHRELEPTHLHLDVLAAGVLLRYFSMYQDACLKPFTRARGLWVLLGLLLVSPSAFVWNGLGPVSGNWIAALAPTLNLLGCGLLVFEATQFSFPRSGWGGWLVKPFDYFGKHSYSIYLWHLPVKQWLVDRVMPPTTDGPLYLIFFVAASLAVGTLFSEILEMPFLHLRNRLFPSMLQRPLPRAPETAGKPSAENRA
jgi:peptidoglycan/LPS O-acetylase OafA/YrhL